MQYVQLEKEEDEDDGGEESDMSRRNMLRRKRKRDREDEEEDREGREGEEDREGEDRKKRKGEIAKRGEEVINAILKRIAKFAKEKTEKGMLLIFVVAWTVAACRGMLTRNLLTGDVCLMLLILFIINLINIK